MSQECLRTGDKALIRFRFIKYPEYMVPGQRMVFREGRTKAVGNVVKIYTHLSNTQLTSRTKQSKNPQRFPQNTKMHSSGQTGETNNVTGDGSGTIVGSSSEKRENPSKSNAAHNNKKNRGKRGGKNKSNQSPGLNKPLSDVANITPLNVGSNRTIARVQ